MSAESEAPNHRAAAEASTEDPPDRHRKKLKALQSLGYVVHAKLSDKETGGSIHRLGHGNWIAEAVLLPENPAVDLIRITQYAPGKKARLLQPRPFSVRHRDGWYLDHEIDAVRLGPRGVEARSALSLKGDGGAEWWTTAPAADLLDGFAHEETEQICALAAIVSVARPANFAAFRLYYSDFAGYAENMRRNEDKQVFRGSRPDPSIPE